MMNESVQAFKPTSDDWKPSHQLKQNGSPMLVRVRYLPLSLLAGAKVCVYGRGDLLMELSFNSRSAAWDMWIKVISQPTVEQDWLAKEGFTYA